MANYGLLRLFQTVIARPFDCLTRRNFRDAAAHKNVLIMLKSGADCNAFLWQALGKMVSLVRYPVDRSHCLKMGKRDLTSVFLRCFFPSTKLRLLLLCAFFLRFSCVAMLYTRQQSTLLSNHVNARLFEKSLQFVTEYSFA